MDLLESHAQVCYLPSLPNNASHAASIPYPNHYLPPRSASWSTLAHSSMAELLDFDPEIYMLCPGPIVGGIATGQCMAVIPKDITCTGVNRDKRYRRCTRCSYFAWWPFEDAAASTSPSAVTTHPLGDFPRPAYSPVRNIGYNQSTSLPHRPSTPQIDPVLACSTMDVQTLSAPTQPFITGRQGHRPGKAVCSSSPCTRLLTASCTNGMCKTCCMKNSSVCMYKGHNKGRRPVSTSNDPFHMPRPLPALPLLSTMTIDPSSSLALPVSRASLRVPPLLAADHNRRRQDRELRQESEASRVENERRIKHAVLLVAYLKDASPPTFFPLQDIKTWPTLNLRRLPHLYGQLGLDSADVLELYVSSAYGKFWIPTLDHSMTVKTEQQVFIRRQGVVTVQHPSTVMDPFMFSSKEPTGALDLGPQTPRKRARNSSPPLARPLKISCIDLTSDESPLSSPVAVPSSPCPLSSPSHSPPSATASYACSGSLNSMESDSDQLWLSGSVLTPPQMGVIWPQKLYARDMAQAFAFLADVTATDDLPARFSRVFNGMRWKPSTYHSNRSFWFALPEHIKQEARLLPRTPEGIWTVWRKGKPGWNSK
ncbi:hypothetical protein BDZ97DRAFT_2073594 [Flammula alnicola]|nr:hypothetical protein BDZ97DRAFT_2073594 [Flammula alnicola]